MKASYIPGKTGLAWGLFLLIFISCSTEKDNLPQPTQPKLKVAYTYDFPPEVFSIISQDTLDAFRNAGMPIYEGTTPPGISTGRSEAISFLMQNVCIADNKNPANVGKRYDDFSESIYIYNLDPGYEVNVNYKSGRDNCGPALGFASGTDSTFSVFFKVKDGVVNGIPYKALWVVSGIVNRNSFGLIDGIKDLHNAFLMLEKGADSEDQAANPGTMRIFRDLDSLSGKL